MLSATLGSVSNLENAVWRTEARGDPTNAFGRMRRKSFLFPTYSASRASAMRATTLRVERLSVPLAQRAPAEVRHAEVQFGGADNPELGDSHNLAVSFQNQMAQALSSPTNLAIRPSLIKIRVGE